MEPTRIHEDKDPVEQPDVHCPIDALIKSTLHRLFANPVDLELVMAEYMAVVRPLMSATDPEEYNKVRLAMFARHLASHLGERSSQLISDLLTSALATHLNFTPEEQERYHDAVIMGDGTIGREFNLGNGMSAFIGMAEAGDYSEEWDHIPPYVAEDEPEGPYKPRG